MSKSGWIAIRQRYLFNGGSQGRTELEREEIKNEVTDTRRQVFWSSQ
jgi:hypothetical protein